MLNVFANYRWNYNNFEVDMRYKTDRWTNKVWVEFYPHLAVTPNGIDYPVIKKYAVSGYLVSEWLERMKLTYLYYGINSFLLFNILFLLAMIFKKRKESHEE